jgi:peptidoglycan-associated lipoprotein
MSRTLLLSTLAFVAAGCAAKSVTAPGHVRTPAPPTDSAPVVATAPQSSHDDDAAAAELENRPLYYQLDSAMLSSEAQDHLAKLGEALLKRTGVKVKISGHTCELGTSEYNLALGLQRAAAAKEYLVRLGVAGERISIVSYGEERPSEEGSDESAFSKNRRSEVVMSDVEAG